MTDQRTLVERGRALGHHSWCSTQFLTDDTCDCDHAIVSELADAIEQAEARIAVLKDALTFTQEHLKHALDDKQPLVELWEWRAHAAEARIAELQKENRELRGGDEISGGLRIPFSDRKQIGQLAKKLRAAEARIAELTWEREDCCKAEAHNANRAEAAEARLRKAERLAKAVAFHLRVEGPPIDTVVVAALADFNFDAFRTTEDAK